MNQITKLEYLKYAIEGTLLDNLDWYMAMMSLPIDEYVKNTYYRIIDKRYQVKVGDEWSILTDADYKDPIFRSNFKVIVTKEMLINVAEDIETTFGSVIVNYILLTSNFKDIVPFVNGGFKLTDIENNVIAKLLVDDGTGEAGVNIEVKDYIKFVDSCSFLKNLAPLVSVSSTPKTLLAPPGLKEYKAKVMAEMIKRDGPDVFKDYAKVAELEGKLKAFDAEWLKDDPSYGKMLSGKVLNVARAKMFLTHGAEVGFNPQDDADLVANSLEEGWPTEPEQLAAMFNTTRIGSISRGMETQKGGLMAKILLRVSNSVISPGDCGTKFGKSVKVTPTLANALSGRYHIKAGKSVNIESNDDANGLIGSTIILRSPQYCKEPGDNYCSVCSGDGLAAYPTGIPLLMTEMGGTVLLSAMKKMHGGSLKTLKLDILSEIT